MVLFEKKLYYRQNDVTHALDLYSDISGATGDFVEIQYSGKLVYVSSQDAGILLTKLLECGDHRRATAIERSLAW